MNLYENLCDNIKECEIKIGYQKSALTFYYPKSSLCELLDTDEKDLDAAILAFCGDSSTPLGKVRISETSEEGRYAVGVTGEAVEWVHNNRTNSAFLVQFLKDIKTFGKTLEDIAALFESFCFGASGERLDTVTIEKEEEREWGIFFTKGRVDPYVYYVEEDDFGLEYHRFTHPAYELLKNLDNNGHGIL